MNVLFGLWLGLWMGVAVGCFFERRRWCRSVGRLDVAAARRMYRVADVTPWDRI